MATSERIEIRQSTIDKARRDAAAGERREVADIVCRGLVLRVQPSGCVWQARIQHRGKAYRVTIGSIDIWSLAQAREVGRSVRWHVTSDHGVPDAYWVKAQHDRLLWVERHAERRGKDDPDDPRPNRPLVRAREERLKTWTYRQAREAWGRHLEAEAAVGNLVPETVRNYSTVVGCPAMRALDDLPVARITDVDVDRIVQALVRDGKRSTARDVVRVGKRMWKWLHRPANRAASGVTRGTLDDVEAPDLGNVKKRQRYPELARLGGVVAIARSGALDPVVGAAIELLAWTAQRRLTIARAHIDEFVDWEGRAGWGLWRVGHRKSHKDDGTVPHTIPLPPTAWVRVRGHLAWLATHVPSSEWVFPARRDGQSDKPAKVGHIDPGTLTKALPTLPGAVMTPHDVRRTFPTSLANAGHHLTFVGYVMDHMSLGSVTTRDENGTTRRYTEAEMLTFKAPVMETWEGLLEPATRAAALPPLTELKAQIVRLRNERRGVSAAKEKARMKVVNAAAYAEGRTFQQRRRAGGCRQEPVSDGTA